MLEKNMKQVNQLMTRIYRLCTVAILALVVCSWTGIYDDYTDRWIDHCCHTGNSDTFFAGSAAERLYAFYGGGVYRNTGNELRNITRESLREGYDGYHTAALLELKSKGLTKSEILI